MKVEWGHIVEVFLKVFETATLLFPDKVMEMSVVSVQVGELALTWGLFIIRNVTMCHCKT